MKQLALSYFENPDLILIPLLIFIVFFVFILISVFRKSNQKLYDYLSRLPLEDEEENHV
ncbi:MAG: CcoQ/FixQ family Cbb3-type cytochrome c oxidase assembly chaperone [Candidatus Dadabacteria bacterium]|nr:CcoQ/FixQ family Cbb3-type cytochrome c oxidase assembly chaperone [Candidatus Dadabacteria bacterium]NIQ14878.1 CcoQ/FixQ family Cbb3-type cytochrome c oxidase assembly chaperone [Candidatus Dadabacteria bacterium]